MKRIISTLLFGCLAFLAVGQQKIILCKLLIDGTGQTRDNVAIVIEKDRIVSVGPAGQLPTGAEVIDLRAYTVMPGLIDMHSHPLVNGDEYQIQHLEKSSAQKALEGLKRAQEFMMSGWTTLRIAGDADVGYAHLEIRNAINRGYFDGPRIYGAGHWISATGGGGDVNFMSYEQHLEVDGLIVNSKEEMRKAVRNEIKYGSDWIKLLVSGAYATAGDNPKNVHLTLEEVQVAIEEAGRRDVPVMAHAHSAEAIKIAARAGARTIEHGSFIDEEGMKIMIEKGTYLIPTLTVFKFNLDMLKNSKALSKAYQITVANSPSRDAGYRKAIQMGVKFGVGTDFFGNPVPFSLNEFSELVRLGMTPMQAIVTATKVNSEILGKEKDLGTIEPGKWADIIAVEGNPLTDINNIKNTRFVMVGGKVMRQTSK